MRHWLEATRSEQSPPCPPWPFPPAACLSSGRVSGAAPHWAQSKPRPWGQRAQRRERGAAGPRVRKAGPRLQGRGPGPPARSPERPLPCACIAHASAGTWGVNHVSLSRSCFLALKRTPILLILRMGKKSCLSFWLRRWLNFSIYSCKRDISSHGFYPSSVYAHFK